MDEVSVPELPHELGPLPESKYRLWHSLLSAHEQTKGSATL